MIYATTSASKIRAFLARWAIPAWLSLTCHGLVFHQLWLSDQENKTKAREQSTTFQLLEDRMVVLEQPDLSTEQIPKMVTQTEFNELDDAFYLSVNDIRKTLGATATSADLRALQQQVQAIETKLQQPVATPIPSKPRQKARKVEQPTPPTFQIIGRELRGGERFLSIAPLGALSLEQSRVMRIGETYDGWKLDGFDDQSAVFIVNGETRRLSIR
nr:hypothetical protein [Pseudomonas caspiana]